MDLATRIRIFINSLNIGSSQFADNCNIPRPTLSQILSGRNKKVSDEIIGKIHQTYPDLSIIWLMFGEGEMLVQENIKISEPQEGEVIDFGSLQQVENNTFTKAQPTSDFVPDFTPEKFADPTLFNQAGVDTPKTDTPLNQAEPQQPSTFSPNNANGKNTPVSTNINIIPNKNKEIINIMVFYSDNSFDSFVPSGHK